jgi:hypothetical protein
MANKAKPATGGIGALVGLLLFGACAIAVAHDDNDDKSSSTTSVSTPTRPAEEQAALDAVTPACSETPDKLDAEAAKTVELLEEKGVDDETTVTVLQHLRQSIPDGAPVMNCSTVLAPYITMRTGGR